MELRYHRLGTDPASDVVVLARPDQPEWGFEPEVSNDGRTLVVTISRGTDPETRIHVADLSGGAEQAVVRPLLDAADARYEHIATVDGTAYILTDRDAPLGRVIAVEIGDPARVREIVPEGGDALEQVRLIGGRLIATYLHHAQHRVAVLELDGRHVADVRLPDVGKIGEIAGRPEDPEAFLLFECFMAPPALLAVRMADGVAPGRPARARLGPGRLRHGADVRDIA
jgi:prolyl oligopeptidase